MFPKSSRVLSVFSLACLAFGLTMGCAAEQGDTSSAESNVNAGAKQGELCGDGTFGAPDVDCAAGLECVYTPSSGPDGSSSGPIGKCEKP